MKIFSQTIVKREASMNFFVLNCIVALSTIAYNVNGHIHREFIKFPQTLVVETSGCELYTYNMENLSENIKYVYTNTCFAGNFTELPININRGRGSKQKYLYDTDWDFVNEKIYAIPTDESLKTSNLMVIDKINNKYTILMSNLDSPKQIKLDPLTGLLFISNSSSIIKANMDGTSMEKIMKNNENITITSLFIDYYNKKIYWIDSFLKLCTSDYKDQDVRIITVNYFNSIPMFMIMKVAYDLNNSHLVIMSRILTGVTDLAAPNNTNVTTTTEIRYIHFLRYLNLEIKSLEIYDFELINATLKSHINPCKENPCEHLCLLTNSTKGFSCIAGLDINEHQQCMSKKITEYD